MYVCMYTHIHIYIYIYIYTCTQYTHGLLRPQRQREGAVAEVEHAEVGRPPFNELVYTYVYVYIYIYIHTYGYTMTNCIQ